MVVCPAVPMITSRIQNMIADGTANELRFPKVPAGTGQKRSQKAGPPVTLPHDANGSPLSRCGRSGGGYGRV